MDEANIGREERAVRVSAGTWRLAEVGHAVTSAERTATSATAVRLVVIASDRSTETAISAPAVTL